MSSVPDAKPRVPRDARDKDMKKSRKSVSSSSDDDSDEEDKASLQKRVIEQWQQRKRGARPQGGPIRFKTTFRNTILDVFRANHYKECDNEYDWDIFWTNKEWIRHIYDKIHLEAYQRVNHFRNFYELTRKDLLVKNLKRAKRALPAKEANDYDFFPDTYCLPAEYSLFVEAFKKAGNSLWIMKPIGSSQGKGIFLFDKLNQISDWKNNYSSKPEDLKAEKYIVQRYLSSPLLIGGKKFDLRIYVLVTSYQPLTAYMYRDGFARFSSTRFTMTKGEMTNNYVHLTNVAIQKKGDDYDAESGGKWDVRSLKLYLISKYGVERVNQLFVNIQLICIRSLLAVQKVIINDKHSFEMYGYDILIDSDLKPWLIEVNASPSLTANTEKDYYLKLALLQDTITIVDMEKKLTGSEDQIGGYDLIYRNGFVKFNSNCTFTTYLGCHNNRSTQLRKMWKNIKKKKNEQLPQAANTQNNAAQSSSSNSNQSNQNDNKDRK